MSPDFLANYIAMGPTRSRVSKETESGIPVAMLEVLPTHVPAELIQIADSIRKDVAQSNERLVRRKLRDALDVVRRRPGEFTAGGFAKIRDNIERALKNRNSK